MVTPMAFDLRSPRQWTAQVVVGVLIVVFGLLLTAGNLGWVDRRQVLGLLHFWPLAISAAGVSRLLAADSRSDRIFSGILIFVGVWLTAEEVYAFRIHIFQWWPLLLVLGGVWLISRSWDREMPLAPGASDSSGSEFALWSGVKRRVASPMFTRADLTAVMGGIEMDLRPASTATGDAVIDVFVMWGGIEITVPPDWAVVNHIVPIMGGVVDKSTGTQAAAHRLHLRGVVLMGGIEIKT
jgi:Cell wall-active antibiotics response 4TMS YvqF